MRVVVLGKGMMLANIILGVMDAGAEIAGVFRYEQTCQSRFKLFWEDFFKPAPEVTLIKHYKLNQIRMKSANSDVFQRLLVNLNVDLVIVGTWGEKISPQTFNIPTIATINVHPSLLPRYRGPNPYIQTILNNEQYSGITLHLMDENYDSGAILKQRKIIINDNDTSKELRDKTVRQARELVCELINDFKEHALVPVKQDERYATYYPNITGEEMMIDFTLQTSDEISRTIRALHPFLPTYITHNENFFIIDPYHYNITGTSNADAGAIVDKDYKKSSVSFVCKDKKIIKFLNLKLYKSDKVKNYIKKKVILTK